MCGGSTLESTSKKASSAPAPAAVEKPVVEKLNVAKVTDYSGADYYLQYRDVDRKNDRIEARRYVKAGSTNWNTRGDFYFGSMKGSFQVLKTLPNSLRKSS